jgi:RND family efflux transporter MFP subunit
VEIRLDKSVLRAPFAGQVARRTIDTGVTVAAGQPVLRLLQDDRRLVRIGLPTWIDPRTHLDVQVEVAGQPVPAELNAVRPDIDPATRTRPVLYAIDAMPGVAFGATAALHVEQRISEPGAWVPVGALREGLQGVWTVLVVDAEGVVRQTGVEVQHVEAERAFVTGAFKDGARLVEAGPHRVTPGQRVRVTGEG